MNTLLLIVLGIAGFILVKAALYAAIRQTVAGCRWVTLRYRALCARWRQRQPPPPPALTAPLTRWDEHDIPDLATPWATLTHARHPGARCVTTATGGNYATRSGGVLRRRRR